MELCSLGCVVNQQSSNKLFLKLLCRHHFACFTEAFVYLFVVFSSGHSVSTLPTKDLAVGWQTVWVRAGRAMLCSLFHCVNVVFR